MATQKISGLLAILLALFSFTTPIKKEQSKSGKLKSIRFSGEITTNFIYNKRGALLEKESIYGYTKYYYSERGLLIREDHALNPELLRSSWSANQKNVMMTAQNSTITSIRFFHYNKEQQLQRIKFYAKKNTGFELTTTTEFLHKDGRVFRSNSIDSTGSIIYEFTLYTYDKKGNLVCEKQYCNAAPNYYIPKLVNETIYSFDDEININLQNKTVEVPGYETNTNNVVRLEFSAYTGYTKLTTVTNFTHTLTINKSGLPIKEDTEAGCIEFSYYE